MLSTDDRAVEIHSKFFDTELCARLKALRLVLAYSPSFKLYQFPSYIIQKHTGNSLPYSDIRLLLF